MELPEDIWGYIGEYSSVPRLSGVNRTLRDIEGRVEARQTRRTDLLVRYGSLSNGRAIGQAGDWEAIYYLEQHDLIASVREQIAQGAANSGHLPIVRRMIQLGATDLGAMANEAIAGSHPSIIYYLLTIGYDDYSALSEQIDLQIPYAVDTTDIDNVATWAAIQQDKKLVDLLLSNGASLTGIVTKLAYLKYNDLLSWLLSKGEIVYQQVALAAALSDNEPILRLALDRGVTNIAPVIDNLAWIGSYKLIGELLDRYHVDLYDMIDVGEWSLETILKLYKGDLLTLGETTDLIQQWYEYDT